MVEVHAPLNLKGMTGPNNRVQEVSGHARRQRRRSLELCLVTWADNSEALSKTGEDNLRYRLIIRSAVYLMFGASAQ